MRTMYSTTPAEGAYEVSKGIYAMPAHTHQQAALKAKGWVFHEKQLRQVEEGPQTTEAVTTQEDDHLAKARDLYKEKFGKNPHKNMKVDTIIEKIEEASDD